MNIAIDVSSYAKKGRTGIGLYLRCLVDHLAAIDTVNHYTLCHRLSRLRRWSYLLRVDHPNFRSKVFHERLNPFFPRRLDVFHGTDGRLPTYRNLKTVVTVHDVSVFVSDAYSSEGFRRKKGRRYRDLAERATRIIADSESTRQGLIEHVDTDPARVCVVPLGVSPAFRPCPPEEQAAIRAKYGIEGAFILYVGAITTRKNVQGMLRAFARVAKQSEATLVLAGRPGRNAEAELAPIAELSLAGRVLLTGYVPDQDLAPLYSAARLFAFPTLYEGFGIPLLETMACGTPAVTSNWSSMPEVAGDAALLVDPHDTEAMADAMLRLLADEGLHGELRARGIERAREFTWERTARETLAVYQQAAQAD